MKGKEIESGKGLKSMRKEINCFHEVNEGEKGEIAWCAFVQRDASFLR